MHLKIPNRIKNHKSSFTKNSNRKKTPHCAMVSRFFIDHILSMTSNLHKFHHEMLPTSV